VPWYCLDGLCAIGSSHEQTAYSSRRLPYPAVRSSQHSLPGDDGLIYVTQTCYWRCIQGTFLWKFGLS